MPAPDPVVARVLATLCADADGHLVLPRRVLFLRVADRLLPDHEIARTARLGLFAPADRAIRDARALVLAEYGVRVARIRTKSINDGYRVALADAQAANTD